MTDERSLARPPPQAQQPWPPSDAHLQFYAVAGARPYNSPAVRVTDVVGLKTEFNVPTAWMEDHKPVLHVENSDYISPGKKLHLEPLFPLLIRYGATNTWAVAVPVTNLRLRCHLVVGTHRTKAEADAHRQRLREL